MTMFIPPGGELACAACPVWNAAAIRKPGIAIKAARYTCVSFIFFPFVASRLKSACENRRSRSKAVCCKSGLHHADRNLDVASCGVGICTGFAVRGVHDSLSDFAFQARHADVKTRSVNKNIDSIAA